MANEKKLGAGQQFGQWTLTGEAPLGRGGNGEVWAATNAAGVAGAIKLLHKNNITDPSRAARLTRFRDEITFLRAEANREGILPLLDSHFPDAPTVEDRPWLVTPLATPFPKLDLAGASRLPELVRRMERLARTLAGLHADGKFHRDLKPDNMFELNGQAVIGDFGLVDFPEKGPVTEPAELMGPLFYLAPEMMENAADVPGGPADVYAFAKTLWVLASGQTFPLQGEQRADIPQLRLSTNCPHSRATILDRLLDRASRYDSHQRPAMIEVANELAAWLDAPTPETLAVDFEALAKELRPTFEARQATERRRQEFLRDAEGIIGQFNGVLERIARDTATATGNPPQVGSGTLPPRFHASQTREHGLVLKRWVRMVESAQGDLYLVRLQSFIQVEALSTERIRVVAGHLVRYDIGRSSAPHWQFPWDAAVEAPCGSAELKNDLQRLYVEFPNNLSKALQAFAEQVKTAPNI